MGSGSVFLPLDHARKELRGIGGSGTLPPSLAIELAFKRMKSIMGLGHLPKKDPASARWGAISPFTKEALKYSLMLEHFTQTNSQFPPRPMLYWN